MKTTSHLRMFIVAATMTAIACSDPEVVPKTKPGGPPSNQITTHEFHATVTSWDRADGSTFVGFVYVPNFELSKATISIVGNGRTTRIDTYLDVTRLTQAHNANESYMWATAKSNILQLNYVGNTPTSLPPSPLDVIIVY